MVGVFFGNYASIFRISFMQEPEPVQTHEPNTIIIGCWSSCYLLGFLTGNLEIRSVCLDDNDIIKMDGFDVVRAFKPMKTAFFDRKSITKPSDFRQIPGKCVRDMYMDHSTSKKYESPVKHRHNQNPMKIPRYTKHQMNPKRMTRSNQQQKRRY